MHYVLAGQAWGHFSITSILHSDVPLSAQPCSFIANKSTCSYTEPCNQWL